MAKLTFDQLRDLAGHFGAKDRVHVAEIARLAVCSKGENAAEILAQIARSQPALFYSRPNKKRKYA